MKYFLHDTSAMEDEKISKLFVKFGYEGVGLFYATLEKLAKQEKPIEVNVLKFQLKVGKRLEKCWKFMEEIGIINTSNGETFNKQLLNFSEKYKIKKEKNTERISQWRKNQHFTENVTRYEHICNTPKGIVSKVNVINNNKETECHDIEKFLLENQISFDKICIATYKMPDEVKRHIHEFHLWFTKNNKYPQNIKALLAGVESWIINSKNFKNGNSKTPSATHGKSSGAYELAEQLREELGFN